MTKKDLEWRVVPEDEAHDRWCNVPEAMEEGRVVYHEDPRLPYDWSGLCLHGRPCYGVGEKVEVDRYCKKGHLLSRTGRVNAQGNRVCLRCNADTARNRRLRRKNGPVSAGQVA